MLRNQVVTLIGCNIYSQMSEIVLPLMFSHRFSADVEYRGLH